MEFEAAKCTMHRIVFTSHKNNCTLVFFYKNQNSTLDLLLSKPVKNEEFENLW